MPKLRLTLINTGKRTEHEFDDEVITIGKHPANLVFVPDPRVSRYHAKIQKCGSLFQVQDIGSLNGTAVNARACPKDEWVNIHPGDQITLAHDAALIEFIEGAAASSVSFDERPIDAEMTISQSADELFGQLAPMMPAHSIGNSPEVEAELKRHREHIELLEKRIELISQLNQSLGSVFSLDEIYNRSADILFQATPADRCLIMRLNDNGELEPVLTRLANERESMDAVPVSRTITNQVRQKRNSILWNQSTEDEDNPGTLIQFGIHSVMCAPLIGRSDQLLGVVYADRESATESFEKDHLGLLNTVAGPTAAAMDSVLTLERLKQEAATRTAYNRFLPPHLVDRMVASPEQQIELGGANQVVSVLFSDVRGFTTLSEKERPEKVVGLLNHYFTEMTEIIFSRTGALDKFIGDGLMALFGAPEKTDNDATNAILAAIDMQRKMVDFANELSELHGIPPISIGIGINTGEVTVGYIGSEKRTDYTAIGDHVNLAARLEGQAKPGQILVTRSALDASGTEFPTKCLGEINVKGKTQSVEVYEIEWK